MLTVKLLSVGGICTVPPRGRRSDEIRPEHDRGRVVTLRGGPRHGWAYFETDLMASQTAAEYMGRQFDYTRTDDPAVWAHCPAPRTELPRSAEPPPTGDLNATECERCEQPIRRVTGPYGLVTLAAELVRGGLIEFDERGQAQRRPIADVIGGVGFGYDLHECPPAAVDAPRGPD